MLTAYVAVAFLTKAPEYSTAGFVGPNLLTVAALAQVPLEQLRTVKLVSVEDESLRCPTR